MSIAVITINNLSPALEHKSGEVAVIAQALTEAARAIQVAQGTVTSGNITVRGNNEIIGTWAYTPQASLP